MGSLQRVEESTGYLKDYKTLSAQKSSKRIDIEDLLREPYRRILCYPTSDEKEAKNRLRQLRKLNVNSIILQGTTEIAGMKILGKGCVSIVVKTELNGRSLALKIRRVDANRVSMDREVEMSKLANSVGIGPRIHSHTKDMILMDWVIGQDLTTWVRSLKGPGSTLRIRRILRGLLKQCFVMDQLGLDHGQLSNLRKHVIVGRKLVILDFESSSSSRRTSNVTSSSQYLFVGGPISKRIRRFMRLRDYDSIIERLRDYKSTKNEESFVSLLQKVRL